MITQEYIIKYHHWRLCYKFPMEVNHTGSGSGTKHTSTAVFLMLRVNLYRYVTFMESAGQEDFASQSLCQFPKFSFCLSVQTFITHLTEQS